MTANTTAFNFRTGGQAAGEADKAAREANKGRSGLDYFSLPGDGDETVLRLLTDHDDWIWVGQHSFVPTKPAPKDAGEKWPKAMGAVCRADEAFKGHYDGCYICDNKLKNNFGKVAYSQIRVWALAIERELVRGDGSEALGGPAKNGIVIGVRDKVEEVKELGADGKPTGNTLTYPKLLIVNQPVKGFFAKFAALYGLNGTVCDRDFVIKREGTGTDTTYHITGLDPMPSHKPGTPAWDVYMQSLTERQVNLGAIIAEKASDAYYARFFDPRFEVDKDGNVTSTGSSGSLMDLGAASQPSGGMSADLKAKIQNLGVPSNNG